jgi:hypothetical protein
MRKALRYLLVPAVFAVVAGAGLATTAAPANAQFYLNFSTPYYYTPYYYGPRSYYGPPGYYYAPRCYWDAYYGRVCY